MTTRSGREYGPEVEQFQRKMKALNPIPKYSKPKAQISLSPVTEEDEEEGDEEQPIIQVDLKEEEKEKQICNAIFESETKGNKFKIAIVYSDCDKKGGKINKKKRRSLRRIRCKRSCQTRRPVSAKMVRKLRSQHADRPTKDILKKRSRKTRKRK